ncbi:MAG: hypothetical protein ACE5KG_00725 [Nitrososphaerales archaeon]
MVRFRYIIVGLLIVANLLLLANFITVTSLSRTESSEVSRTVPRSFFLEIIEDTGSSSSHIAWDCTVTTGTDLTILSGTGSSLRILRMGPPYQIDCKKTADVDGNIFFYLKVMFIPDGDELPTSRYLGSATIDRASATARISWPSR